MRPLLGCFVEIGVDADLPAQAIEKAFNAIEQIQARMSFQAPESALSRLNRAGGAWVRLDRQTRCVLQLARGLGARSAERFNCTVGGALVGRGVLPALPMPVMDGGTSQDIEIEGDAARLRRPVAVTLDGIAKGFAVDCAVRVLRRLGARGGWINAGGDLRVFGACELPLTARDAHGALQALGSLSTGAVAASWVAAGDTAASLAGAAQSFPAFIVGAQEAKTGEVFHVFARSAWRADALTKVAACSPAQERAAVVARLGAYLLESSALPNPKPAPR